MGFRFWLNEAGKGPGPFVKELRRGALSRLRRWKDDGYWKKLRNAHQGRRGFVIGNGPSLRMSDLDLLNDEITLASNRIYLAFDQTSWHPTFLSIVDELVWEKFHAEVLDSVEAVHIPNHIQHIFDDARRVRTWRTLGGCWELPEGEGFSDDLAFGAFGGASVTYENLQIAFHLGLDPVYLIGCDHAYKGEENLKKAAPIEVGDEVNHFLPNYRTPGEKVNPAPIGKMEFAYRTAKQFAEKTGKTILNATRGGKLEIFKRVDFEKLFHEQVTLDR